jgi:FMN phosphatase YigB (HAD superfamily)
MKLNYKNLPKVILADCDGVLLDWEWAFSVWMRDRGYTIKEGAKKSYYLHHHYNELEEKDRLFREKVRELEALFKKESLDKLKDITFIEEDGQENTKGISLVGKGDEEGSEGSDQPQEDND